MLPTPTRTPPFQRRRYDPNSNEKDNGGLHNPRGRRTTTTQNHHQSRKPFQDLRVNPFSQSNSNNINNNYPGLDHAFEKQCNSSSIIATTPDRSSSIISPPPISDYLNMSIGARAAINEHTRHVAKYGLDGEKTTTSSIIETTPNRTRPSPTKTNTNYSSIMKDEEWDRLMDGSISHASFSSTFLVDNNRSLISHALSTHHGRSGDRGGAGTIIGGNHYNYHHQHHNISTSSALNITSDQSSDFFTSSRVNMLTTPEKNKAKVDEASRLARLDGVGLPNHRGDGGGMMIRAHHNNYSESISGSTDNHDDDESGMIGLFNAAMRFGERIEEDRDYNDDYHHGTEEEEEEEEEPSLVSYQEPNLSLISNNFTGIDDLVHDGGIHDDEDHNDDYEQGTIPAHSFMNQNTSSPEKAPSEFFRPIHHDQESSFVSYHEPDLSIIDKQNDEPDISLIKNTDDDDLQDDTIGREFKKGLNEIVLDDRDECAFNQSHTLSGIHQNVARTQKVDDSFNVTSQKILDGGHSLSKVEMDKDSNVGGQIHEFESQTVSDFNPIFSQINDYEDVIHEWVDKEVGSTTIEPESDNKWDKTGSEIELDSNRLANLTANYTDFPKALEESNICMLRNQYPSPEKSDFNVDVSEIRTASECDSRFLRAKVTIPHQLQSSYGTLHRSSNRGDKGRDNIRDMISLNDDSNVNVNRDMLGLSPISGDSPSEFDNGTFKRSLPSSTSSMLSKQHRQDSNSSRSSQQSNTAHERKQSMKPHVSRLRERYSRPDRFEDSYVMSSMHNPTPNFSSDYEEYDRSISRSLLETFEHAS